MLTKSIMILLMCSLVYSEWRWADDTISFTMDKRAHMGVSSGLYFMFRHKGYTEIQSIKYSFYLGIGKELIDAVLPHEKYGDWGGDGFSKYDLYYDVVGIGLAYIIDKWWKPKEYSKWERGFSTTGISIHYRLD